MFLKNEVSHFFKNASVRIVLYFFPCKNFLSIYIKQLTGDHRQTIISGEKLSRSISFRKPVGSCFDQPRAQGRQNDEATRLLWSRVCISTMADLKNKKSF